MFVFLIEPIDFGNICAESQSDENGSDRTWIFHSEYSCKTECDRQYSIIANI
ncbi:hypothetical protein QT970_16410 [Microcoleus sp. herbarium8]|uniref:hypothetical protein n=1 Tax=Microcoleus sp. herbarium8 TaxID=3055436 RepID=UPI002FD10173